VPPARLVNRQRTTIARPTHFARSSSVSPARLRQRTKTDIGPPTSLASFSVVSPPLCTDKERQSLPHSFESSSVVPQHGFVNRQRPQSLDPLSLANSSVVSPAWLRQRTRPTIGHPHSLCEVSHRVSGHGFVKRQRPTSLTTLTCEVTSVVLRTARQPQRTTSLDHAHLRVTSVVAS